jgi:uncharacterized integral membrane protein
MLKLDQQDVQALNNIKMNYHDVLLLAATSALTSQFDKVKVKDHVEGELYTLLDEYDELGVSADNYHTFMHVINITLQVAWPITQSVDNLQRNIPNIEFVDVNIVGDTTVVYTYHMVG